MGSERKLEASTSRPRCMYDIFLSFRGKDTRKTFTDHLYTALKNAGFHTFRDDDELERGESVKSELERAIRESKISIVVFSRNYATSGWCLDELANIVERRRNFGHKILPIFYDVEPSEVEHQRGSFAEAFKGFEERIKTETDQQKRKERILKLERWRAGLQEVANLSGMVLQNEANGHEAKFIQEIIRKVENKLNRTVLCVPSYTVGIESRVEKINLWLRDGSIDPGVGVIYGMGGIGKTTIAKVAYNQNYREFDASSFLLNIGEASQQPNGLVNLQRQLLRDILIGKDFKIYNVDKGIIDIRQAISCKRVLLVLDGVDDMEQLDAIIGLREWFYPGRKERIYDWFLPGSKIIITTRRELLFNPHEVHWMFKIKELDDCEALKLFSWHAFWKDDPGKDFIECSSSVVRHCGGLPLALEAMGWSLNGKTMEVWESEIEKMEMILHHKIMRMLEISYNSLQDDHDKNLFLRITSSFVGADKDHAVRMLEECGFCGAFGIQNLVDRGLVSVDINNKLRVHHLLQIMAGEIIRRESKNECWKYYKLSDNGDSMDSSMERTGESGLSSRGRSLKEHTIVGFFTWLLVITSLIILLPAYVKRT